MITKSLVKDWTIEMVQKLWSWSMDARVVLRSFHVDKNMSWWPLGIGVRGCSLFGWQVEVLVLLALLWKVEGGRWCCTWSGVGVIGCWKLVR